MRLVLALALLVPVTASADVDGFRLNRFAPPPSTEDGLVLALPTTLARMQYSAMLTFDFADRPFVLVNAAGEERDVIASSLGAHVDLALGVTDRVEVRVAIPMILAQDAEPGTLGGDPYGAGSVAVSDVRLGGAAQLRPGVGAAVDVMLPFGGHDDFASDGGLGIEGHVLAALTVTRVVLAIDAGVSVRPHNEFADVRLGSELQARFGAHVLASDELRLLGEVALAVPLREQMGEPPLPAEAYVGLRYHTGPWMIGVGGGFGLSDALGVPAFRSIITFARSEPLVTTPPNPFRVRE